MGLLPYTTTLKEAMGTRSPSVHRRNVGGSGSLVPLRTLPQCKGQWAAGLLQYTVAQQVQWAVGLLQFTAALQGVVGLL